MINRRSLRRNCIAAYASYAIDRSIDRLFCLRRSAAYTIDRRPLPSYGFAPYASCTTYRSIDRSFCLLRNTAYTINRRSLRLRTLRARSISRPIDRSIAPPVFVVILRIRPIDGLSDDAASLRTPRTRSSSICIVYDRRS